MRKIIMQSTSPVRFIQQNYRNGLFGVVAAKIDYTAGTKRISQICILSPPPEATDDECIQWKEAIKTSSLFIDAFKQDETECKLNIREILRQSTTMTVFETITIYEGSYKEAAKSVENNSFDTNPKLIKTVFQKTYKYTKS